MWVKSFEKIYAGISKESIWRAWTDVNNWPQWDSGIDCCKEFETFEEGECFKLKPKGGPEVKIVLSKVADYSQFTDYCKLLGAIMYDDHTIEDVPEGVKITNTITIKGPLTFLWRRLIGKGMVKSMPEQTDSLVQYARSLND